MLGQVRRPRQHVVAEDPRLAHGLPQVGQNSYAGRARVGRDHRAVHRADAGTEDQVGPDLRFHQGAQHPDLGSTEHAAAAEHERYLAGRSCQLVPHLPTSHRAPSRWRRRSPPHVPWLARRVNPRRAGSRTRARRRGRPARRNTGGRDARHDPVEPLVGARRMPARRSRTFLSRIGDGPARRRQLDAAKAVCADCDVRQLCLDYALATRQAHGVWGGRPRPSDEGWPDSCAAQGNAARG